MAIPNPSNVPDVRAGDQITAASENRLRATIRQIVGTLTKQLIGERANHKAEITAIANDYLSVKLINLIDDDVYGAAFDAAKPQMLRHDYTLYEGLTSLTTTKAQEVDASDGSTTETWKVTPSWQVGDRVRVRRTNKSGVTVSSSDLGWEVAEDNRAWAREA